ncbi:MAG: response regulator transcription factor [Candidatus Dormibacteraeota bacterium]|nr:response regulator transcription factor [Candidatus Dormibacteraeota bacterium]
MNGLNCTASEVVRLALDELRDRHPSSTRLEAALRKYLWQERGRQGGAAGLVGVSLRRQAGVGTGPARGHAVRVLVVEAHPVLRAGLGSLLAGRNGIEVVALLDDFEAATTVVRRGRPQVVLMSLPAEVEGMEAVRTLAEARPETRVLVLAEAGDGDRVLAAVAAGAAGYLPRDAGPDELARGVLAAARGESGEALRAALALVGESSGGGRRPQGLTLEGPLLTRRERQVLALVGRGLANKQIGRQLGISEKTVKAHLGRTFQRIGVGDRTQAALWAQRNGILEQA